MSDITWWKYVGLGSYWLTLPIHILLLFFFFPGLDFISVFICNTDLLIEICLDELESFSTCLEKGVVEFYNHHACAQRLEHLPKSD